MIKITGEGLEQVINTDSGVNDLLLRNAFEYVLSEVKLETVRKTYNQFSINWFLEVMIVMDSNI